MRTRRSIAQVRLLQRARGGPRGRRARVRAARRAWPTASPRSSSRRAHNNQANVDLLNQVTQLASEMQALRAQVEELQQQNEQLQRRRTQPVPRPRRPPATGSKAAAPRPPSPRRPPPAPPPRRRAAARRRTDRAAGRSTATPGALGPGRRRTRRLRRRLRCAQGRPLRQSARAVPGLPRSTTRTAATRPTRCTGWARATTSPRTTRWRRSSSRPAGPLSRPTTRRRARCSRSACRSTALEQYDAAERTLAEVASRYPGTDAARTADDRLRAIQLGQRRADARGRSQRSALAGRPAAR